MELPVVETMPGDLHAAVVPAINLGLTVLGLTAYLIVFHGAPGFLVLFALWLLIGWAVSLGCLAVTLLLYRKRRTPAIRMAAWLSAAGLLPYMVLFILWANRLYLPLI